MALGSATLVVRSALAVRIGMAAFFACGTILFAWAALAATPGSLTSQWVGHVCFSGASLLCVLLCVRSFASGHLEVTEASVRFSTIRGTRSVSVSDITSITKEADWRPYAIAPVVHLKDGSRIRLSDFASRRSALLRHPTSCACVRALLALARAVPACTDVCDWRQ